MAFKDQSNKKWTYEQKKMLVECRLAMEPEFSKKRQTRRVLWGQVLQKLREVDPNMTFSRGDITRKYLNMMTTYRRIKKRNNSSGEAATAWDYFDQFDEVYGSRHDIVMLENNLESPSNSLLTVIKNECSDEDMVRLDPPSIQFTLDEDTEANPPPRKRARDDIFEFLRTQSESDKMILKEILQCEKEKLSIEREKLQEIRKLREAFEAFNK